jgi:uncharacterized heparinase superfamily protein
MVDAFGTLSRADGTLHLFNDAANGIAPSRAHLDRLADRVLGRRVPDSEGAIELPAAGYYGWKARDKGVRLLIDCGNPGARHQPGHAHCDLLSFELDVDGRPVIVDSGVHGYDGDPYREYARSTRAHNTVMLGELEQSEIWGTFRVARMATVRRAEHRFDGGEYCFEGAYAPYHNRRWVHGREVRLGPDRLRVIDRVHAAVGTEVRSFLHLHPRFRIRSVDSAIVVAASESGDVIRIRWIGADAIRTGRGADDPEGWYLPEFGRAEPAPVIEALASSAADGEVAMSYEISWN